MARRGDPRLTVIAEGIELPEDAQELIALGCRYGQGFLYAAGRPKAP